MTEVSKNLRNIFFPKIPPILNLKLDFFPFRIFSAFFFPNRKIFILSKLHICKFEKKSENPFRTLRRAVITTACTAVVRGEASQLGAPGFGTERARLVVQVERLRCTRLRHRTCKTSRSSKRNSLRRFAAYWGFARGLKKAPITHKET